MNPTNLFKRRNFNGRSCTRVFSRIDLLETGRRIILYDNNLHNSVLAAWVCALLKELISVSESVTRPYRCDYRLCFAIIAPVKLRTGQCRVNAKPFESQLPMRVAEMITVWSRGSFFFAFLTITTSRGTRSSSCPPSIVF